MENFDLLKLKKQYLACVPLEKLELPKELNLKVQSLILSQIINDSLLKKYPIKNSYLKNFLKMLIKRLENNNEEIEDALYELFCNSLSLEESPMHYRHFLIDSDTERVIIKESRTIISEGTTGLCSWQAAEVLAEWCLEHKNELYGKSIVELGSGVGLTGITVLKTCNLMSYTFTDCHPRVLNLLQENIELNKVELKETKVLIEELAWESISEYKEANWTSPDVILAADVVYDSSVFASLINAVYLLLKNPTSYAIIGVTVRNQDTLDAFLQELRKWKLEYEDLSLPEYKIFEPASTPVKVIKIKRYF